MFSFFFFMAQSLPSSFYPPCSRMDVIHSLIMSKKTHTYTHNIILMFTINK